MSVRTISKGVLENVTITHVSLVKRGKNLKPFFIVKGDIPAVQFDVKFIEKAETVIDDEHYFYGIVYEPESADYEEDSMTAEEIEKTANEFMQHYRNIDKQHDLVAGQGTVVQSYIAPVDMDMDGTIVKKGSWVLVTKVDNDTYKEWQDGEITGYSMFGIARNKKVSKGVPIMKSWFNKFAESIGISKSFDEKFDAEIERMATSPDFILSIMRDDFWNKMNWKDSKVEQLKELSIAMKSAAQYVDAKVLELEPAMVEKGINETEEIPPEPEQETPVAENAEVEIPVVDEGTEDNVEQIPETETVEEPEIEVVNVQELISKAITDSEARSAEIIGELTQKLEDYETKINKLSTESAVVGRVNISKAIPEDGSGLL